MTVEEIDRSLADWQAKLDAASNNVMAMIESITYRRLTGLGGFPQADLKGITRDRVAPALAAMTELWQLFALLNDTIKHAADQRASLPKIFGTQDRLNDIERLLNGPSVKLPQVQTPLAQRQLLTPGDNTQSVTPTRLLQVMTSAFQTARDVVVAVDEAWTRLEPALADAQKETERLQQLAASLGEASNPQLEELVRRVAALRVQLESDPLGVHGDYAASIHPQLETVRRRLEQAARDREAVRSAIGNARARQAALVELNRRCEAAWDDASVKIEGAAPLPRKDPSLLAPLLARLDNMEKHLADGTWSTQQVSRGLDAWRQQAGDFEKSEKAAVEAYEGMLAEREELRGLLAVYRRRAEKRGVIEDAGLNALVGQAESLLHSPRKTPLAAARDLVNQVRERIAALAGNP